MTEFWFYGSTHAGFGFVTGHDFSRADSIGNNPGL
jgi:hypothetical protein